MTLCLFSKNTGVICWLFWIPHIMELSRRCLVKGNILLKTALFEPRSGPLFHLYALHTAVCLIQSMYMKHIPDLATSAKSHCSQSLECFRIWNPPLKTCEFLLLCSFATAVKYVVPWLVHLLLSLSIFSRCLNVKPKWKDTVVWKL